jgi:FkbM family methyltransferase
MTILPNGVAVCGTTHHAVWCAEKGLVHDRWFADEVCRHIKPGDVCVNAGAHIGTIAKAMADAGGKVVTFEPNREARDCLNYNCRFPSCLNYGFALGESSYKAGLVRHPNAGASFIQREICTPRNGAHVRPLDLFNLSPILIVADIEGYEVKMLEGARETIKRCHPILILEVNRFALERAGDSDDALFALVEEMGYTWRVMQENCRRGDPQLDIECLPK